MMFSLPTSTIVDRFFPKNAFDSYINSKQKRAFTTKIAKITWLNQLTKDTIQLTGKNIKEIQIIKIELKKREKIDNLLNLMNKTIPYKIIFSICFENEMYISTSAKHPHPSKLNFSVIDYTFCSNWFEIVENPYTLQLKGDLDSIYFNFCKQFARGERQMESMEDLINQEKEINRIEKEIKRLETALMKEKQFNKKVELNLRLKKTKREMNEIIQVN